MTTTEDWMTAEDILDAQDEDYTFSQALVIQMLKEHHSKPAEFFEDCGKHESYAGYVVLEWLGY